MTFSDRSDDAVPPSHGFRDIQLVAEWAGRAYLGVRKNAPFSEAALKRMQFRIQSGQRR